jgi:pimeloyl-ACP methyl ester carboxylesterase
MRISGHRIEISLVPGTRTDLPVIVLLHEALGSVAHWKDLPSRLSAATGASVVVYSRQGHGRSSPLTGPRSIRYLHDEADVLPALLDRAGILKPILLGHSDGASIALLYAGAHPDDVAGLVLEAPHVFVEDVAVSGVARATSRYRTTDFRERLARYHDDADSVFQAWSDIWQDPAFGNWNIEAALDAITCPVLLIQGTDDEYGTLEQIERIRRRLPQAEATILAQCGHTPHRDQPEATLKAIVAFVGSVGRSMRSVRPFS